ncbi:MAG: type II toxin-antitoxin system HicB family antitoxin [Chthoniobacterales bacterium]
MNSKYEIVVYWSEQDGCFLAEVPELPSIIMDGPTRVEALQNAEDMIDAYVAAAREASWEIPNRKGVSRLANRLLSAKGGARLAIGK